METNDTVGSPNPYSAPLAYVSDVQISTPGVAKADRGIRLAAVLLDGVPTFVIAMVGAVLAFTVGTANDGKLSSFGIAVLVIMGLLILGFGIYQLVQLHLTGQTFGKKMLGIKIVRNDGSRAGLGRIFWLRMFVPGLMGAIPFAGGLFSLVDSLFIFSEEQRCLHDLIADTIVIRA